MAQSTVQESVTDLLERARAEGRRVLLEPEGLALAGSLGLAVPRFILARDAHDLDPAALAGLGTERAVVKVVSPDVLHKTDVGGLAVVPNERPAVVGAIERIEQALGGRFAVRGYLVAAFVEHDRGLGGELLLGFRRTQDLGPIVTLGPGGVYTEFLARQLDHGRAALMFAPGLSERGRIATRLERRAFPALVAGLTRGGTVRAGAEVLAQLVNAMLEFATSPESDAIEEFELNPIALTGSGPVALDALVTLTGPARAAPPPRPIAKIGRLLEPRTIAIAGVSERMNPGRIILQNILRKGFPSDRLWIIKPGGREIDGVACVADIAALPGPVDLLVLAVSADQVPSALDAAVRDRKAESVVVIPGGLGERPGTEALEHRVRETLAKARATPWGGPVLNGGNCLGIRSVPGRYDTMFIPPHKLPAPPAATAPLAVIGQSGAFIVSRGSRMLDANPRYEISIGNQSDLTFGDYLRYLADDPALTVFACYVEGFQPLDGRRWLDAARDIVVSGRDVVLYRAGRTDAGVRATRSHTAAVAGDFAALRDLAEEVGVLVADTLDDFDDLTRLALALGGRRPRGHRLAAVTNAGFECVAIADRLGPFRLAQLSPATVARVRTVLSAARLEEIVTAQNPLDLTPIADDATYEAAVDAVLADPNVDVGLVGCVPLTPALATLPAAATHAEDLASDGSVAVRLGRLTRHSIPWVAVVDAGPTYDPFARALERAGLAVFRSADRAVRLLAQFAHARAPEPSLGDTRTW